MRKIVMLAAAVALSACGKQGSKEEAPTVKATPAALVFDAFRRGRAYCGRFARAST